MIKAILNCYAERLEEFLRTDFPQPEGVVEVGLVGNSPEGKKLNFLPGTIVYVE